MKGRIDFWGSKIRFFLHVQKKEKPDWMVYTEVHTPFEEYAPRLYLSTIAFMVFMIIVFIALCIYFEFITITI